MDEVDEALTLGAQLFELCASGERRQIESLLQDGAPVWYSEPETGWTVLHLAASLEDEALVKLLLENSAVWNAVDVSGFTAGDIAMSLNNQGIYRLIRDAGIRSEFLLHILEKRAGEPPDSFILKAEDVTAAGSSTTFLSSRLRYTTDNHGQEICLASLPGQEEVGVMMGWESGIMQETVKKLLVDQETDTNLHVLNIGFGLGIIDKLFQTYTQPPSLHVIIEAHPDVLAHMLKTGWYDKPGVIVLEGKWQDLITSEEVYAAGGFDVIYTDTFSESYSDLLEFFENVPNLLRDEDSRFSFFNGLGATNALFYDVYSNVVELHLSEIGLVTSWSDVEISPGFLGREEEEELDVWGETRVYFNLPLYRLPICRMQ